MNYLKEIIAVVPGPLLAWVNGWIHVFEGTFLVRPGSGPSLDSTGAAIATVASIVIAYLCRHVRSTFLIFGSLGCAVVSIGAFIAILWIRGTLSEPAPRQVVESWYYRWDVIYIGFLVFVVLTILLAIMSLLNRQTRMPPANAAESPQ